MRAGLILCLLLSSLHSANLAAQSGEDSTGQSAVLLEIPDPNLEGVDPAVARQMLEQLGQTREAARSTSLEPRQLAGSFGSLGEIFLLYEMFIQAESAFVNASMLDPESHRWHYFLGVITQELRRLEEATGYFQKVIDMDPGYLAALIRLGDIERLANRPEEARIWYQRALDLFPRSPATQWGLGQIAYGAGDSQSAVEHFELVLEMQPEASAVHYPLALAYRDLGELDKAREHLEQRGERKVVPLDPLVDGLPQRLEGYSLYLLRGNQTFSQGNFEVAATAYSKAVEADPESALARHAYASALTQLGRLDEAVEQLEWVVEHSPEDGIAHYNLGTLEFQRGEADKALDHLQRAVEYSPDFPEARFNLGLLLEQHGRMAEALEQYVEARRLDPQDSGVRIRCAALQARFGRSDEALSELEGILSVDPDNFEARLTLGSILEETSRLEDALEQYRLVIDGSEDPQEQARAHFSSGQLLLVAGQTGQAIEQLESTLELMPRIAEARTALASALAREGRLAAAAEQFSTVIEQSPDNLDAHIGRALALLLDRRDAQAVNDLEQSLTALPNQAELSHLLSRVLATSADAGVRDGERSLRMAEQVLMQQRTLSNAETVAMALAEVGRFEDAVRLQSRILQEATQRGSPELAQIESRLRRYERADPVRSPWLGEGEGTSR